MNIKKSARNYVQDNRGWKVFRRHFPMVLKAFLAAVLVASFWRYVAYPNEWHLSELSLEPMMFVVIVVAAFVYSLLLNVVIGTVYDQYQAISKSVVRNDVDTFLTYRDEQVPILLHILVGTNSLALLVGALLIDYQGESVTGTLVIFIVTLILAMGWSVTNELDNFERSIWFDVNIPDEWKEMDPKKHFWKESVDS